MSPPASIGISSLVLALGAGAAVAQEPLKAGVVGNPRIGQTAPDVTLPYFTATGPGPADQPFRLSSELGHVVVLVFPGAPNEATRPDWDALVASTDSVLGAGTVVVGILRSGAPATQTHASALAGSFKFLSDSGGRAYRRYGVDLGKRVTPWTVFVVGDDGRIVHRSSSFRPTDAAELRRVGDAIKRGHTALARPGA